MVHSFPTRRSSDLCRPPALPAGPARARRGGNRHGRRQRSEEHTSELQSHHPPSYAVFCLKKKKEARMIEHLKAQKKLKDSQWKLICTANSADLLDFCDFFVFGFFF